MITGLETGGAEQMLYKLLTTAELRSGSAVVSLTGRGTFARKIERLGVPVLTLGMNLGMPNPFALLTLSHYWRQHNPDLVQGWMYHGNLATTLSAMHLKSTVPHCWNVRHSLHDLSCEKLVHRIFIRAGAVFSRFPRSIVYNSTTAMQQHEKLGYSSLTSHFIPNGFDCARYRPDPRSRRRVRHCLGLQNATVAVGLVARYHPSKGHDLFLQAAVEVQQGHPDVMFVLAGRGVDDPNGKLWQMVTRDFSHLNVRLLGERDARVLLPGLDILAVASVSGDSFSNVIGEAMACGVPVVTTDVGDCARLVTKFGVAVPAGDSSRLAKGIHQLIDHGAEGRAALGRVARSQCQESYSIEQIARQYRAHYEMVLSQGGGR